MRGSMILAGLAVVADVGLAAAAVIAAGAGGGFWESQAYVGASGLLATALGGILIAGGLPRIGTLTSIGGLVLAGAYLRWEPMPWVVGPATVGALAVLAVFLRELASGQNVGGGKVSIPVTRSGRSLGVGIGIACVALAVAGALGHRAAWQETALRDAEFEAQRAASMHGP